MKALRVIFCMAALMFALLQPAGAQTAVVTLTTYHAVATECDGDPLTTADGTKIVPHDVENGRQRIVSVSRDLLKLFPYGTRIRIEGLGVYVVHDTMNKRFARRIDVLIPTKHKGTKRTNVTITKV